MEFLWSYPQEKNVGYIFTNTENYWVFGLCPSSGIQKTRTCNVLEAGSLSVLT
jgi:hypothetical protein